MIQKPKFCKPFVATRLKKRAAEYNNKSILHFNISDYLSAYADCAIYIEIYNISKELFNDDKISLIICPHILEIHKLMGELEDYLP